MAPGDWFDGFVNEGLAFFLLGHALAVRSISQTPDAVGMAIAAHLFAAPVRRAFLPQRSPESRG
jgi:hypothetical protein